MPDPAKLPYEIFAMILNLAFEDSKRDSVQHLYALSLFNRRWNKALLPRMYSEWTYNGARQSFMTLWKFFITIRRDPYLAGLVRTLTIGNWGFYRPRNPEQFQSQFSQLSLPPDELALLRTAIHDAGIGRREDRILRSLSERDRRPVVALLLVSLPNLQSVSAYYPRRDPFMKAVLENAVGWENGASYSPGLLCLKELHLFNEVPAIWPGNRQSLKDLGGDFTDSDTGSNEDTDTGNIDDPYDSDENDNLDVDYLCPIFHLPSIRTLSLPNLDYTGAATGIIGNINAMHQLEGLSITSSAPIGEEWLYLDLWVLITQPRALKYLEFHLTNTDFIGGVINPNLWNSLQKQKASLENLDLCIVQHSDEDGFIDRVPPLNRLSELTSLKHLSVHAETLLGRFENDSVATFRLRDTLPTSLISLTFYQEDAYGYSEDLPEQLMEVILSGDFPLLRTIVLQEMLGSDYESDYLEPNYKAVENVCLERGIDFQMKADDQVPRHGICGDIFDKTEYLKKDGCLRTLALDRGQIEYFKDLQELTLRDNRL